MKTHMWMSAYNADSVVTQFKTTPTHQFLKGVFVKENIPSSGLVEIQVCCDMWINSCFSNC